MCILPVGWFDDLAFDALKLFLNPTIHCTYLGGMSKSSNLSLGWADNDEDDDDHNNKDNHNYDNKDNHSNKGNHNKGLEDWTR